MSYSGYDDGSFQYRGKIYDERLDSISNGRHEPYEMAFFQGFNVALLRWLIERSGKVDR